MARGMVYQYAEKWPEAKEIYGQVLKLFDEDDVEIGLEAREQHAWCGIQCGEEEEATLELRSAIQLLDSLDGKDEQKARAWWRLGKALWNSGGGCFVRALAVS